MKLLPIATAGPQAAIVPVDESEPGMLDIPQFGAEYRALTCGCCSTTSITRTGWKVEAVVNCCRLGSIQMVGIGFSIGMRGC